MQYQHGCQKVIRNEMEVNSTVEVKIGGSTLNAVVLQKGPKQVYKVTYDGWPSCYDEYVTAENCTSVKSGEKLTADAKVNKGDKLKVKWLDGSTYVGTVLSQEVAVACIRPDAYPKEYQIWITANDLAKDYQLKETGTSKNAVSAVEVGKQVTVKLMNGSKVKANVIKMGPMPVIFVTYEGWSKVYDEYVEANQCKHSKTGAEITDVSQVKVNDKLRVKWLDGGVYEGTVLRISNAVARVNPVGYQKGYELWVTEKEIVTADDTGQEKEKTGNILEDAIANVLKDASSYISNFQEECLQIKRKDEIPARKVPKSSEHVKKDSPKWKKILSKSLMSERDVNKLKKKASEMRKPAWSGKKMDSDESHVAIGASKDDLEFAKMVERALVKRGLKVTANQDDLHNSRAFLLIYSDSVDTDENIIRHLTRAAERFNMGETIILALVRPGCPEEVIDHIPDRVAYSLSNVVFFHYDCFGEQPRNGRRQTIDDLVSLVRNYVAQTHEYDLTGTWLCQAVVTSNVTSYSRCRDFTMLLKQQGTKVTGRTVNNFKVDGELHRNTLKLRLTFRGKYQQNLELWEEEDYYFIAEISAMITNQGYRLEGDYIEETDCWSDGKGGALKFDANSGPFNATLERQCLSGYYNAFWHRKPDYEETFAIIHRGGNELIAEFPMEFGSLNVGFLDVSSSNLQMNSCSNRNMARTLIGKLTKDSEGASAFQCLGYGCEFGLTGEPESIALTRDPIHMIKPASEDDDELLEEIHQSVSKRLQGIPFTPGSYSPVQKDEFPVVIFCTQHEMEKAEKLKYELETVQEIQPVSLKASDWKKSRTIVLLLSKFTQTDKDLIDVIAAAAEQELPIFNIGLDSWFSIFGSDNWEDQDLRLKLMNALARLNQTPDTTLDPNHSNYRGLVKGIRKRIEPPKFSLIGLFGVKVMGSNPPEKITKYSDLEDETIQMIKRPLMMYLYFEPASNKLSMGTDYIVQGLTGEIDPETFRLTMKNDAGSYDLSMNADMDKLYGTYWSERANKEYTILATKAETGISGFYAMGGQQTPTGIVQLGKKTADIVFGGYMLPAVISNDKFIFNAPYPGKKDILLTYAAQIILKPEGNYVFGFSYQSQATTQRNAFDAKQYAGGTLKVSKGKKADDERAETWLLHSIEEFWRAVHIDDYDVLLKISVDDMSSRFPKEAFEKLCIEHKRSMGNYIAESAVYIGKKAQVTMGKPIGATKYDFKFDFEKCKNIDYSVMIMDANKKLNGIQSYEEEAELMDSSQYDVMISYRSWDARWVDLLQSFLEASGYSVWRDRRMDVGVNWSEDITKAVRKSGCVIAAISENYLTSVLCTKEVRMAHDISKPVIPLILPETCPKKNPTEKLVSSSFKESHLPITIANELSDITWIDFRPIAKLDQPDPTNVQSFDKKYGSCLEPLLRLLEELSNHRRVVNLKGDWNVSIGSQNNEERLKLSILATIGSQIEGVMTSHKHLNADIPLDKAVSVCNGSNLHFVGHHKGKGFANSYIIDAKISADGNSFTGVGRIHKTPWEHPVGQQVNPLVLGLTHYSTTNDCAIYPVKGIREVPLRGRESDESTKEEFILDMERAYGIIKGAFKDLKKEALEMSIVSYKEAFEKYDVDGSHELDMNELELALRVANMNCSKEEKDRIMAELDQDESGTVDFYEFLEYIAKIKESKVKQNSAAALVVKKGFVSKVCAVQ